VVSRHLFSSAVRVGGADPQRMLADLGAYPNVNLAFATACPAAPLWEMRDPESRQAPRAVTRTGLLPI